MGGAGAAGGLMLADSLWPGSRHALAYGLIAGSVLGATLGVVGVLLVGRRGPGD